MNAQSILGFTWKIATMTEVIFIYLFLLAVGGLFAAMIVVQKRRERKLHDHQLFLFKMKNLGLSIYQSKIIENIIATLGLRDPNRLFDTPAFFEDAIGRFLLFLRERREEAETLASICRDIAIIYAKLYHPVRFQKQLESIHEAENDQFVCFSNRQGHVFLGKITGNENGAIRVRLFRDPRELRMLAGENEIRVHLWRLGDAEYVFDSHTAGIEGDTLVMRVPDSFSREKEFRHPYLDLMAPAVMERSVAPGEDPGEKISGVLVKINDYEAVLRLDRKIEYRFDYFLEFEMVSFTFRTLVRVLANKVIEEGGLVYHTVKFVDMSEQARTVLKKFMYEHL